MPLATKDPPILDEKLSQTPYGVFSKKFLRVLECLGLSLKKLINRGASPEQLQNEEFQKGLEAELWYMGDLSYLLKPAAQTDIYRFTIDWQEAHPNEVGPVVWNAHRGIGKSHLGLLVLISRCLRDPGHIARFASPTGKQTKDIVAQPLKTILDECPDAIYPEKSYENYYFRNPRWEDPKAVSVLNLCGCKEMAGAKRGPRSDTIFVDEGREVDNLEYVISHVFGPHFITREKHNPLLILSSTPPDYGTHPYWTEFCEPAEREDRYIRRNVNENADFTPADRNMLVKVCRGTESTAWKREALCEKVTDEDRMVIPEMAHKEVRDVVLVDDWTRPKYFKPHMGADLGLMANTALLWGYIHWPTGEKDEKLLIVEDEVVVHYKSIGELAKALKEKEAALYAEAPFRDTLGRPVIRRFADNDALALQSFRVDHGIQISAADKWDYEAGFALLRTNLQTGKIRILKRCERLIKQLENGLLTNKGKIEHSDDTTIGHCDAIMALNYLNKSINWRDNPIPFRPVGGANMFVRRQPIDLHVSPVAISREPLAVTMSELVQ